MKKFYMLILLAYCMQHTSAQNTFPSTGAAGVGTTTPDASSLFEIKSTTKGLLIPRMTAAQRNSIVSPATGLLVYQTNATSGFVYYNGTAWKALAPAGVNKSLSNLTAPTAVNADLLPGNDNSINLGSITKAWKDIYLDGSVYFGGKKFIGYGNGAGNIAIGSGALYHNTGEHDLVALGDSALYFQSTDGFYHPSGNTAIGSKALYNNTTGSPNTANGNHALYFNTQGSHNTANGSNTLYFNTTGWYNTAIGDEALYHNTTANYNTATGTTALYTNSTGSDNTATGAGALEFNTTGDGNTANGKQALRFNKTGANNTATGKEALISNSTGTANTATGAGALYSNFTGSGNTANGINALYSNTGGFQNTANGFAALYSNTSGYENIATGIGALYFNTTGIENVATGDYALYSNNMGNNNTANGYNALRHNTTGNENTANGSYALEFNTSGHSNIAIGTYALNNNSEGSNLVAVGDSALFSADSGISNTAIGSKALWKTTTGSANTALGISAGSAITSQSNNTVIGAFAGNEYASSNSTLIGYDADPNGVYTNISALGYKAKNTANNQVMLGNTSVTSVKAAGSYVIYSDGRYKKDLKENVPGLEFIKQLRPVTYHYNIHGMNEYMGIKQMDKETSQPEEAAISEKERKLYTGFVAQDVEAAAKKLNYDFSGIYHPQNDKDLYGLSYADFVVPLVKAVQELNKMNDGKNAAIDSLKKINNTQDNRINDLQKQIDELKSLMQQVKQCSPCNAATGSTAVQQNSIMHTDVISLEQNIPNPFTNTTTIAYSLPKKFSSAQIIITDKNGKQLKQLNISGAGKGAIHVDASTLASGAYNYSLYVDGKLVDTRQMIAAK